MYEDLDTMGNKSLLADVDNYAHTTVLGLRKNYKYDDKKKRGSWTYTSKEARALSELLIQLADICDKVDKINKASIEPVFQYEAEKQDIAARARAAKAEERKKNVAVRKTEKARVKVDDVKHARKKASTKAVSSIA
jgi:hypothetical protein